MATEFPGKLLKPWFNLLRGWILPLVVALREVVVHKNPIGICQGGFKKMEIMPQGLLAFCAQG